MQLSAFSFLSDKLNIASPRAYLYVSRNPNVKSIRHAHWLVNSYDIVSRHFQKQSFLVSLGGCGRHDSDHEDVLRQTDPNASSDDSMQGAA